MPYAPRATLDNPYGPQITFRTEDVLPPSAYYVSPEDRVTVWLMTDVLAQTIYIQLRMLMPTGEMKLIPYQFAPQFTYDWYPAYEVPPWEGYLVGAMCWTSNPQRGRCYVSVQVMRSQPPNLQQAGVVLLQGYIDSLNVLSYPTSPLQPTFSGRGAFLTESQPNTTGAGFIIQAPQNTLWRVSSFAFTLNTSAAAGNRTAIVNLYDSSNNLLGFWNATTAQAASLSWPYSFSCGVANNTMPGYMTICGPVELMLPAQTSLDVSIVNMSATDTITNIAMQVEEWMGA